MALEEKTVDCLATVFKAYPKNRTGGIPMPLIPTHMDGSV
jgi:hypothetical protein